jgi:hypothetical protein
VAGPRGVVRDQQSQHHLGACWKHESQKTGQPADSQSAFEQETCTFKLEKRHP